MKIDKETYIAGGYYLDFDSLGQLRVFGPNNHLYLGLVDIPRHKLRIDSVKEKTIAEKRTRPSGKVGKTGEEEKEEKVGVEVKGAFTAEKVNLYLPVMGDVRTIRHITEDFKNELRSFLKMRESRHTLHGEAQPMRVEKSKVKSRKSKVIFRRDYGKYYYQSSFEFPARVEVEEIEKPYKGFALRTKNQEPKTKNTDEKHKNTSEQLGKLSKSENSVNQRIGMSDTQTSRDTDLAETPKHRETDTLKFSEFSETAQEIPFTLLCETNDAEVYDRSCVLLGKEAIGFSVFGKDEKKIKGFWERTRMEVEHMLCWGKTSGDRFGTVFPRDWMETAALGEGDIPRPGIDYMLKKSLAHVSEDGEGWHEDVVGEYKYKHEAAGRDLFDRKMIDIEPWYFICLRWVTDGFWQDDEAVSALRRSAKYILRRAARQEYITFEPLPPTEEIPAWQKSFGLEQGYYAKGDWRDSEWAYKHIHPIVAPFSVSAVFYPEALKTILRFSDKLGVAKDRVAELERVWRRKKEAYRFKDYNGNEGFALALYNGRKRLRVHHLDEAYLYFLSDNYTKAEAVGFARRLLDFEYFYTESGPLIVARNNEMGYTDEEYHGLVIWTKQAAFAIAGLARALRLKEAELPREEQELLREAVLKTALNLSRAYCQLDALPELHRDSNGTAVEWMGDAGSSVQLWSAVGARRIFREYEKLRKS